MVIGPTFPEHGIAFCQVIQGVPKKKDTLNREIKWQIINIIFEN